MDALDALGLCLSHIGTHLDIMEGIPDSNKDISITMLAKGDKCVCPSITRPSITAVTES